LSAQIRQPRKIGFRNGAAQRLYFFQTALATVHPSSLLRAPDEETRRREMELFLEDLKKLAEVLRSAK
jgi:DNA polymerase